jgi:hypothetical protein
MVIAWQAAAAQIAKEAAPDVDDMKAVGKKALKDGEEAAKSAGKQAADTASEEKQKMDSYMGMAGNTVKVQALASIHVFFLWGRNGLSGSP